MESARRDDSNNPADQTGIISAKGLLDVVESCGWDGVGVESSTDHPSHHVTCGQSSSCSLVPM